MNINIVGLHLEVTPAIRDYATEKFTRVFKHFDKVIDAQLVLAIEKVQHRAEITIHVPGKDIHCEAQAETLYAAIDLLQEKASRMVLKYKEKLNTH